MKHIENWKPTKFIYDKEGRLTANKSYVNCRSWLVVNKMAFFYNKFLKEHAKGILADLGCGTVPLYGVYKEEVEKVICVDWVNSNHENIHLDYTADLNKEIPLSPETVDTVLLSDVLEHIKNPNKLMSEISMILRKEGKLILGVPFYYWLHEEPYDFHRYTRYQLVNLCEENGMSLVELEEWGGPLSVILDIIGKNLPDKLFFNTFPDISNWIINTKFGKSIDNRNKESFPLGYCLVAKKTDLLKY